MVLSPGKVFDYHSLRNFLIFFCFTIIAISTAFAQETITDIDGNVYETVLIGNQRWIKSNLRVKRYRNGDPIPEIRDDGAWMNARFGAWCYLNNDPATEEEYGLLYNAYAFLDPRGLAPEGTYVMSACDWGELHIELEGRIPGSFGENSLHDKIKVPDFFSLPGDSNPTNSSGLSIKPSGYREGNRGFFITGLAKHWTTSLRDVQNGIPRFFHTYIIPQSKSCNGAVGAFEANWGFAIRVLVGEERQKQILIEEEQTFCGRTFVNQLQFSVKKENSFACSSQYPMDCYLQQTWFKDIDFTIPASNSEELKDGDKIYGKVEHIYLDLNFSKTVCQEEILEVTVRILDPEPPTGEETQVLCAGATIEDLVATGDEIRWYPTLTSTTPIAPGTLLQNSRLYYAENRSGNCINPTRFRVQVELVSPTRPTAAATHEVCEGTRLSGLTVQGDNLVWYSEAGEELSPETLAADNATYLVASKVSDCESDRVQVRTVLTGPAVPTAAENQEFCPGAKVSELSATGQNILWYASAIGGSPLDPETPLTDATSYYATQTVDGCESRSRREVRVTLLSVPTVTAPQLQEFCNVATVSNLQATGSNIRWYADQDLSNLLTPNSPLENGRTYFATQTLNGCEGPSLSVQVAINVVATPQGDSEQGFCTGATIADLVASGNEIRWFASATGGTAIANTVLLQNGITYFAEQQSGNCQSASRLAVRVAISSTDLPTAAANQTLCTGATVDDIAITGQNIRWYASATGNDLLSNTEPLVDGRTYFASQTIGGCESASRRSVQVRIVNVSPVTTPQNQTFCNIATVSNLQATGTNIRWYADQNLTQLLTPSSPLENGRTYYTTQTQEGCQSTAVTVQVSITNVAAPSGNAEQEFCNGAFVSDLTVTGTSVQWFSTATGGSPLANNLPLQDGAVYYAEQTINNCQSATRLAVRVRINIPQLPGGASQQEFCEGASVSELQATGTNLVWYRNATGPETINPNDPIQDGGIYYVSQRIGNCESARKEVRASIIRVQPAIAEGEQQFCESDAPTVAKLFAVGESIRWYSSPSGGNPLGETERLMDGQTYYAVNVARGCESSTRTAVRVSVQPCEVEVFNMVTRDGNNKNEYLKIKNIESFPDNRLEIFNRYGVLVWAVDGYGQDGKFFYGESNQPGISQAGLGLPTGNYLYALTYKKPGATLPVRETGYLYLLNIQR